jgi:hypothetical protein
MRSAIGAGLADQALPYFGYDSPIAIAQSGRKRMLAAMLLMAQSALDLPPILPTTGPTLPKMISVMPPCDSSDDDDIVICGKSDPEQYRLRPLGTPPGGKPLPPMTAKLGNGTIDGRAVEHCVGGFCAPAAMVTFKVPF